jgi:nucleoside 2-deoxyribosyltransferase
MKKIYLAGLISTEKPESIQWRLDATANLHDFIILSPMRGKQNLSAASKDGGITSETNTSKDIILRDYHDVMEADLILFNLNTWESQRPLLGTIYELAWAWEHKKRSFAVCEDKDYLMRNHPFVKETISHYFTNLKDCYDFIRRQQ